MTTTSILSDEQWTKWMSTAYPPALVYDPPQLHDSVINACRVCWWDYGSPRSKLCSEPIIPCCGRCCCYIELQCVACCSAHTERISKPEV
jgi:hypothetical protein